MSCSVCEILLIMVNIHVDLTQVLLYTDMPTLKIRSQLIKIYTVFHTYYDLIEINVIIH